MIEYTEIYAEPIVGISFGFEFISSDEIHEDEHGYYLVIDLIFLRILIHKVYG